MPNGEEQLTESQLKFSYWFVTHKILLRKIGIGILIGFNIIVCGFGIYGLADYFLISWNKDLAMRRSLSESIINPELAQVLAPLPINTVSVDVYSIGSSRYDFVSLLQNNNSDWYATFRYKFSTNAGETDLIDGFILPSEEKHIGQFGRELTGFASQADLVFSDFKWRRVNRHIVRDYESWKNERLNFIVSNATQTSDLRIDKTIGRTSFDIKNNTAFGYWQAGLFIALGRGAGVGAANYITLSGFDSGETRHVDINWFEDLPATSSVSIVPDINIFDSRVYMPPRAR